MIHLRRRERPGGAGLRGKLAGVVAGEEGFIETFYPNDTIIPDLFDLHTCLGEIGDGRLLRPQHTLQMRDGGADAANHCFASAQRRQGLPELVVFGVRRVAIVFHRTVGEAHPEAGIVVAVFHHGLLELVLDQRPALCTDGMGGEKEQRCTRIRGDAQGKL